MYAHRDPVPTPTRSAAIQPEGVARAGSAGSGRDAFRIVSTVRARSGRLMVDAAMAGSSRLATSGCLPLPLTVRRRTVPAIGPHRKLRVRALNAPSLAISAPAHTQ